MYSYENGIFRVSVRNLTERVPQQQAQQYGMVKVSRVEPVRIYRRTLLGEHGQKREVQSYERSKLRFSEKQRFRSNTREYCDDAPQYSPLENGPKRT